MKRFKNILCVVDIRQADTPSLQRAVKLAENNQASLTVVDAAERISAGIKMPGGGPISADLQTATMDHHRQKLESIVNPYRKHIEIQARVLQGIPFLEIIREVLRNGHDLLIKAPETLDWLDRFFSSDDMHLLRKCPCPVWLVKPEAPETYQRILAAVDVDDACPPTELEVRHSLNREILELAISLSLSEFTELHVVHVWEAIGEGAMRGTLMHTPEEKIISYVEQVRQQHSNNLSALIKDVTASMNQDVLEYVKPRIHLIKGRARKEIPALSARIKADLLVMGTVARTGVPGFLIGNTAETILSQIDCSVLAIKPPGFQTPVTLED
jgi:nucleotide-binding universal stress UspA family protein